MRLTDEAATLQAGFALGERLVSGDLIALSGPLGAGKTCFARGILGALGYNGEIPSPSFALCIPYDPPQTRLSLAHVDLYRINHVSEVEGLGLEEYLSDGALLVEWPELGHVDQWRNALKVTLSVEADYARRLTVHAPKSWEKRCPFP